MAERELDAGALYRPCDISALTFRDTGELDPLELTPGQSRAREAIEFGVDIQRPGFHIFALGAGGLGKRHFVDSILSSRAKSPEPRFDWCYVANFEDPQKPRLLKLDAGMGRELAKDMQQLVEDLLTALPSSFSDEEYRRRRQEIEEEVTERYEEASKKPGTARSSLRNNSPS